MPGAVDQLGERPPGEPGQRLLAGEAAADLERRDAEAVAVLVGQVHDEALVDHRVEQVVRRAPRQVARPHHPVERHRVGLRGQEPQHPQGAGGGGYLAHEVVRESGWGGRQALSESLRVNQPPPSSVFSIGLPGISWAPRVRCGSPGSPPARRRWSAAPGRSRASVSEVVSGVVSEWPRERPRARGWPRTAGWAAGRRRRHLRGVVVGPGGRRGGRGGRRRAPAPRARPRPAGRRPVPRGPRPAARSACSRASSAFRSASAASCWAGGDRGLRLGRGLAAQLLGVGDLGVLVALVDEEGRDGSDDQDETTMTMIRVVTGFLLHFDREGQSGSPRRRVQCFRTPAGESRMSDPSRSAVLAASMSPGVG